MSHFTEIKTQIKDIEALRSVALQVWLAVPISAALVCLQDRVPSAAIRRVQPGQSQASGSVRIFKRFHITG